MSDCFNNSFDLDRIMDGFLTRMNRTNSSSSPNSRSGNQGTNSSSAPSTTSSRRRPASWLYRNGNPEDGPATSTYPPVEAGFRPELWSAAPLPPRPLSPADIARTARAAEAALRQYVEGVGAQRRYEYQEYLRQRTYRLRAEAQRLLNEIREQLREIVEAQQRLDETCRQQERERWDLELGEAAPRSHRNWVRGKRRNHYG